MNSTSTGNTNLIGPQDLTPAQAEVALQGINLLTHPPIKETNSKSNLEGHHGPGSKADNSGGKKSKVLCPPISTNLGRADSCSAAIADQNLILKEKLAVIKAMESKEIGESVRESKAGYL